MDGRYHISSRIHQCGFKSWLVLPHVELSDLPFFDIHDVYFDPPSQVFVYDKSRITKGINENSVKWIIEGTRFSFISCVYSEGLVWSFFKCHFCNTWSHSFYVTRKRVLQKILSSPVKPFIFCDVSRGLKSSPCKLVNIFIVNSLGVRHNYVDIITTISDV